ncbi:MAG: heme-binding protein [SAR202 cluster bacterium]|nr:heme-binding protein [SAR202 cluster bacterium]|tara:strand:- start:17766 stop:18170 length:405 start_codon:yes stop_codon:yes gene_type:complete
MNEISLEDANIVISAAIKKAKELGFNMAIAVVDLQTSLVASARMDGTNPFTPDVVRGKAVATAVTKGTPSGVAASRFPASLLENVRDLYGGRITWVQGAVPLFKNGQLIGAVAAGGGPPDKDEEVAQYGADALN